ncbi:MAG: hypothetical protein V1898_00530 [Patescibacteria group bacterium]
MKQCNQCSKQFETTSEDKDFYKRINVNEPSLCPDCRRQRRMAHRNERNLYQRTCDLCHKPIISQYKPDTGLTVYCRDCWWSDKFNPLDYGQEFDFNKDFFKQWHELILKTPQIAVLDLKSENSAYTHLTTNNRSCYLIFSSDYNEQCYYSNWLQYCKNCVDCFHVTKSELAYQSFFGERLYECEFLIKCFSANESKFCYDCRNIQNCTMCYNLRNKQYCFLNKQYIKEEYEKKLAELKLNTSEGQQEALKKFKDLIKNKAVHSYRNQLGRIINSTGDYLNNTKDCENCFDLHEADKCKHVSNMVQIKDSYDCEYGGVGEFGYENLESYPMPRHSIGSINCCGGNDNFYSFDCQNSKFIFGCSSLKKQEYCILNKKYSEDEYNKLTKQIVEYMKQNNEWGEFMPVKNSLFAYNETNAQDYFPLDKEQTEKNDWQWLNDDAETRHGVSLPKDIKQCKTCQKNFKLIPQEINFYKQHNLLEPDKCYQCRYAERLTWRNNNKIYDRECNKCRTKIKSTYSSGRPEKVYCEDCYKKEIY